MDDESSKELDCITIILTRGEVQQLLGYAKQLLEQPSSSDHYHLSNEDYQKEITICMYDSGKVEHFHPAIKKIIKENEQK